MRILFPESLTQSLWSGVSSRRVFWSLYKVSPSQQVFSYENNSTTFSGHSLTIALLFVRPSRFGTFNSIWNQSEHEWLLEPIKLHKTFLFPLLTRLSLLFLYNNLFSSLFATQRFRLRFTTEYNQVHLGPSLMVTLQWTLAPLSSPPSPGPSPSCLRTIPGYWHITAQTSHSSVRLTNLRTQPWWDPPTYRTNGNCRLEPPVPSFTSSNEKPIRNLQAACSPRNVTITERIWK